MSFGGRDVVNPITACPSELRCKSERSGAPLAQLVRAFDSHSKGRSFESYKGHSHGTHAKHVAGLCKTERCRASLRDRESGLRKFLSDGERIMCGHKTCYTYPK